MSNSLSKNRGEWSELYVLTSLLAHGILTYVLDDGSRKTLEILEISRGIGDGARRYVIEGDRVRVDPFGTFLLMDWLMVKSTELLAEIMNGSGRAFPIPAIDDLLLGLQTHQISADSKKGDISIQVYDPVVGGPTENQFSIKSWLGGSPSLLNSSGATRITYQLSEVLTSSEHTDLNRLGPSLLVETLISLGVSLTFSSMDPRFTSNLTMVDSQMPELLAATVLSSFAGNSRDIRSVIARVAKADPLKLNVPNPELVYSHKIKMLLQEIGLGMVPAKQWSGWHGAGGGFITVLSDGELLCFRAINQEALREELFKTTRFDTPSRKKHDFGYVYHEGGRDYLDLNYQIRFK